MGLSESRLAGRGQPNKTAELPVVALAEAALGQRPPGVCGAPAAVCTPPSSPLPPMSDGWRCAASGWSPRVWGPT